jgi:hypothetical protein
MIKHCFVVTSAINSKFGVYKPEERLQQTLDTVTSIKSRIPDAKIVIMEVTGYPMTPEQEKTLRGACDVFLDFTHDQEVVDLYQSDNWDIVKNGTEIMCFGRALAIMNNENIFKNIDRIHKMSGRYQLNDMFDPLTYEDSDNLDKIIIGPKVQSQFPVQVTDQPWQYMARLWSWPASMTTDIIDVYSKSLVFFAERLDAGGYVDIEHVLARFLPVEHVREIQNTGVEGNIAPNGTPIKN